MTDRSRVGSLDKSTPPRVIKLSNTLVSHPKPASNTSESVKLGVLDHVSAPLLIVKIPFVFSQTLDATLLTTSLESTLRRYPLLSGRLIIDSDGDYSVNLNNAGACLTTAKCPTASLDDVLPAGMVETPSSASSSASSPRESKNSATIEPSVVTGVPGSSYTPVDMDPFLPKVPALILGYRNKDVPLFQAQVTFLKNGGTVLGIAVPHVLADQETCRLLFACWAKEYTALDVSEIGGDSMRDLGNSMQQQQQEKEATAAGEEKQQQQQQQQTTEQSYDIEANGCKKSKNNENRKTSLAATSSVLGHALESHATPALPQNWKSSRFEKRNWRYVPSILGTGLYHTLIAGMPVTVAYYVSAKRLAELKEEATTDLKNAAAAVAASGAATGASGASSSETDVPWISTNDALVARLMQAVGEALPDKAGKRELQLVVDLRKRMEPALPAETLGNCSWTVAVGSSKNSTDTPALGLLAANIRAAILELGNRNNNATSATTATTAGSVSAKSTQPKNINNTDICNELRWLVNNARPNGAQMPVVFQNFSDMVRSSGPILVSHWDWGGVEFKDLSFGGGPECTPVWHQPTFPKLPNCAFIVPAPCGGALVHLTLHKKMAKKMKSKCTAL